MGWDAYAAKTKGHKKKFKAASEAVLEKAGSVDCYLAVGALDCSACARELEAATGCSCWDESGWPAEKVKALAETAYWRPDVSAEDAWAYYSAKAFLETCASIGSGVKFGW